VAENGGQWYVVRTAVIFGPKGASELSKKSFVDIMVDLASKRDTIEAVADEVNSVTYVVDLAAGTRGLLEAAPPPGIYHVSNGGSASWYDLAREIYRVVGGSTTVLPVPAIHFPRKAKRPARAILLNTQLAPMRPWQEALAHFLTS
jgi:dTDP-4-dehydrorhamnose reductase